MVLGFKIQNNGLPTGFVEKINAGTKIHTLREDSGCRWRTNMQIHFATGVRTKQFSIFKLGMCKSIQPVFMSIEDEKINVSIGRNYLYYNDLIDFAKNDGFDTLEAFDSWFRPLIEQTEKGGQYGLNLRLIHWTDKRY